MYVKQTDVGRSDTSAKNNLFGPISDISISTTSPLQGQSYFVWEEQKDGMEMNSDASRCFVKCYTVIFR